MVMHARKLPRLIDGYYDNRNQSHPYQNTGKYSNKSGYNDRYGDKVRDSPSNGSAYRNESPDSQHSPRDRSYHNKSSYSQRLKDRERDRDRHDRDTSHSPKERSGSKSSRDHHQSSSSSSSHRSSDNAEHRSNHDRNSTEDKEKEKRLQVGDWSEHLSSSGKKYYYNCKTEVSQWEKPKEWVEWERQPTPQPQPQQQHQLQAKSSGSDTKVKDRNYEKVPSNTSSNSRASEKHSSERSTVRSSSSATHHHHHSRSHDDRHHFKSGGSGGGGGGGGGGGSSSSSGSSSRNYAANEQGYRSAQPQSSQQHRSENHARTSTTTERNEHRDSSSTTMEDSNRRDSNDRRSDTRKNSEDSQMQDMDISPDSTPTGNSSQPNSQPQSRTQTPISSQQTAAAQQSNTTTQSMSLANLPKLLSQLASNKGLPSLDKTEISAQEALQTLQTALFLTRQVSLAQTNMTNHPPHSSVSHMDTSFLSQKSPLPVPMPSHATMPAVVVVSSAADAKMRADDGGRTSPGGSEYSHRSSRRGSPTSSVSSLHSITAAGTSSLASAALRPAAPLLTPSLANYFREDLIKHVTGWQADHAERQAHRYSEDAHSIGGLNSTKVSAELKTARSFVRVAEIQATLQEQRILFLRQQIKELEDWKSQNSFMSDS